MKRVPWMLRSLALMCVVACSSRSGHSDRDSQVEIADLLPECARYAAAYKRCFASVGADSTAIDAHMAAMERGLLSRASEPAARDELHQSCTAALTRLSPSCQQATAH